MHAALLQLLLLLQQPVERNPDGPRVTMSGRLDFHFAFRAGEIEEARNALNGVPATADDDTYLAGPASLRLDLDWSADLSASLELATRVMDGGDTLTFADRETDVFFHEVFLEMRRFLAEPLTLRAGAQPLRFTNRYEDDAFFLDLAGAESAWSGFGLSGVRATADRDTLQPTGVRLIWDPIIVVRVQAFALWLDEGGSPSGDEAVYGIHAGAKPADTWTVKWITTLFSGPDHGSSVGTTGAGVVLAPAPGWLASVEAFVQYGRSRRGLPKSAWAGDFSLRYSGETTPWWIEAAYEHVSGDDPDDSDDGGFQSYETVNRFAVVQSAEFGLDWDTNYRLLRAEAGIRSNARDVEARINLGWFTLPEEVPGVAVGSDDTLGLELDLWVAVLPNPAARIYLQAGWLTNSDVLDDAWSAVMGTRIQF